MYAAVANGAKYVLLRIFKLKLKFTDYSFRGLVVLGPGAAQLSPSAQAAAADLFSKGIPTVAVARPVTGTGVPGRFPGPMYVLIGPVLN